VLAITKDPAGLFHFSNNDSKAEVNNLLLHMRIQILS